MDTADPQSRPLLVIGYGNTLREDDGVGPRVAGLVEEFGLPGVEVLACPQLSPEHAEAVAGARTVIFVDAAMGSVGPVRLRRLAPAGSARVSTHLASPGTLLALARQVYGRAPNAWMLALPACRMGYGDELSFTAQRGMDAAVRIIRRFARLEQLRLSGPSLGAGSNPFVPEFAESDR
jgi:hydrogenase maturation protease